MTISPNYCNDDLRPPFFAARLQNASPVPRLSRFIWNVLFCFIELGEPGNEASRMLLVVIMHYGYLGMCVQLMKGEMDSYLSNCAPVQCARSAMWEIATY